MAELRAVVRSETRIDSLIIAKWKNQCEARAGQGGGRWSCSRKIMELCFTRICQQGFKH